MSNITDEEIGKLANDETKKISFINQRERMAYYNGIKIGYKAALQNKVSEVNECFFIPDKKGTSLTICANCGKEKSLHTIGEGITVSKVIYQTTDPSTEQSTSNWQAVGDKDKFMDEVRGKESDVNDEENKIRGDIFKIVHENSNVTFITDELYKLFSSIVNKKDNVVNDWISVEDDLPKEDNFYIVYRPIINVDDNEVFYAAWETDHFTIWVNCPLGNVTHWMPLPKPPIESQPK